MPFVAYLNLVFRHGGSPPPYLAIGSGRSRGN